MALETTEKDISITFEQLAITSIGADHCKTPTTILKNLNNLNKTVITFANENSNENHVLSNRFLEVVDVHAPLKTKIVRGNDAPFADKQLRKAIYTYTKLKKKIHKNPSKENKMAYKKQSNF